MKGLCTNFANLKQLDLYALLYEVCHFMKKQKRLWTQHVVTIHSNACHNFEINNKRPHRFYSTATQMMSSVLIAVVVEGRV
jgi:hypothetical protein